MSADEHERLEDHLEGCETCDLATAVLRASVASREPLAETTPSLAAFVRRTRLAREITPGSTLGRFRIVRRLGMGAMGAVFAAHDPELDRGVALKVLFDDGDDPRAPLSARSDRLLREARSMARLSHPNAVTAYQIALDEGRVFLAMELVDGTTLRDWLEGKPTRASIVELFQRVALAVDAAHTAGIVHRDLKPQNILVTMTGQPKVTDFGLASASALSAACEGEGFVGTPSYMAPETLNGRSAGPAADQFALAVCLHEALCGRRPHRATTLAELRTAVAADPSTVLDRTIAQPLRAVIAKALACQPAERFPSVAAFGEALGRAQGRRSPSSRHLFAAGLAVAAVSVLGVTQWRSRTTVASATAATTAPAPMRLAVASPMQGVAPIAVVSGPHPVPSTSAVALRQEQPGQRAPKSLSRPPPAGDESGPPSATSAGSPLDVSPPVEASKASSPPPGDWMRSRL